MDVIKVAKMNETFMHVSCDPSIERELSEHFQFFVPGYKFMPAYRNRVWDGSQVEIGHNYVSMSRKEFQLHKAGTEAYDMSHEPEAKKE